MCLGIASIHDIHKVLAGLRHLLLTHAILRNATEKVVPQTLYFSPQKYNGIVLLKQTSKKDTYIKVSVFNGILKISFQKFFIQKKLFYSYICDPVFILPRFKIIPNYNHLAEGIRYPFQ